MSGSFEILEMKRHFPTLGPLQELVQNARPDQQDIYERWCRVGENLAAHRGDERGCAQEHLDANFDLILRNAEKELQMAIKRFDDWAVGGGMLFAQISLSKMWLFSVYEIVRESCGFPCSDNVDTRYYCKDQDCYRCRSIKPVRDKLNIYRNQIAKLQPERQSWKKKVEKNLHPSIVIDDETGSVGWRVSSQKTGEEHTASRLELSNFILDRLS